MSRLPEGFSELEAFVAIWAVEGSAARAALRGSSTATDRELLFRALQPRLREALAWLDSKPLSAFDAADHALMNLCLSFAHVAMAVEVQGPDETRHARWRPRMHLTRTPAGV